MHRRDFFKASAQTAAVGAAASVPVCPSLGAAGSAGLVQAPAVLKDYTEEDHRHRLQNIGVGTREIRTCLRKHLVTNYLPAQACYNLGEYPCLKPWEIGEYDEQELDRLKDHGIQIIQVFDEWNDALRMFGGNKYSAFNPAGFRRFIDMVHERGMKILPYTSTGFLEQTNPNFRSEWSAGQLCQSGYWDMAYCSPASPGWRAFLLPRLLRVIEQYGLDGIYIDSGYVPNARPSKADKPPAKDEVPAFEETAQYDGAVTDMLALIHAEVKRHGGILKLHMSEADEPKTAGLRVYDYLWVGENVTGADGLRETTKGYLPYVIPCIDVNMAKVDDLNEPYLHAIPYMQFPLLQAGKPFTGERGNIPGVKYYAPSVWVDRCKIAREQYQSHPDGPYSYSNWDAFPGQPETRPTHAYWLKRYMPLVEEGTWAWLEVSDSSLFAHPLPEGVVASAFANRELYVVLANYSHTVVELDTAANYVPADQPSATAAKHWRLAPRSLQILRRSA